MAVTNSDAQLSFSIIDTSMTVDAMRASGYKSTTHALAELIDNSLEAGATVVELFGVSRRSAKTNRQQLVELAVLDNGVGMDSVTLRGSLRYGHGTRRHRSGIGRFGLGLPNSSMSQARQVDVWSWQSGATNALHTRLSIADIEAGVIEVPEPKLKSIPKVYDRTSVHGFEDSGTLVVWSDLDRVEWRRASTTFRHTENLLGRIYRRFLASENDRLHPNDSRSDDIGKRRSITCIPVRDIDGTFEVGETVAVRPNDPLYLMEKTSCPEDFGVGPMFRELDSSPFTIRMPYEGSEYEIRVRASYARAIARDSTVEGATWPSRWAGQDGGRTPWGKHAALNSGVSLMRAHREIQLDESWLSGDDPRERWWTIEVDFPTALDEVFGVTNNKQGTMTFQRLATYDWRREALDDENSAGDVRRRMEREGDHRVKLLELRRQIALARKAMRSKLRQTKIGRGRRHEGGEERKANAAATAAIERRREEGFRGESDRKGETGTKEEHKKEQTESLVGRHHYDEREALREVDETLREGHRVRWINSAQSSPAFFDVESFPNVIQVGFNTNHPLSAHDLFEIASAEIERLDPEELKVRLATLGRTFRVLIYAWARYEDEQLDQARRKVRNARMEWGRYAEEFFDMDDGSIDPTDSV